MTIFTDYRRNDGAVIPPELNLRRNDGPPVEREGLESEWWWNTTFIREDGPTKRSFWGILIGWIRQFISR